MDQYWLDIGAGIDAEHWAATPAPSGVRRVALEPLLTSGMIGSGRLASLPPGVLRVGAELRPQQSVETGKPRSYLPFRDGAFARVHCGFVLHLYLEILELLAEESHRVLQPGGQLDVFLPHFGDGRSEGIVDYTQQVLERRFGTVEIRRHRGPFTSFWADLYQDCTIHLLCWKAA